VNEQTSDISDSVHAGWKATRRKVSLTHTFRLLLKKKVYSSRLLRRWGV
jgi:hypothetical protein